jgi:hypothetical protein
MGRKSTIAIWIKDLAECAVSLSGASIFRRLPSLVFAAMRSGRPRRLLGPTVGTAVVLATAALLTWGAALWVSWGGDCPGPGTKGGALGKGIQAWPPAAQCVDQHGNSFWHQSLPWAPWVVGMFVAAAAAILLTGLVAAIRDLRRPVPVTSPHSPALLEARFAPRGNPDNRPQARGEAADAERGPPAIAA